MLNKFFDFFETYMLSCHVNTLTIIDNFELFFFINLNIFIFIIGLDFII